ncbi:MAG: hypothetical protein ACHBN1_36160 [Heteroscytonema crispum UTEX LB 1556]
MFVSFVAGGAPPVGCFQETRRKGKEIEIGFFVFMNIYGGLRSRPWVAFKHEKRVKSNYSTLITLAEVSSTIFQVSGMTEKQTKNSTNYQLPITNYQLPITNYQLPITHAQCPTCPTRPIPYTPVT